MSRRILSERSGVSQRTIVLLETGKGNISVALLFRVADALNLDLGGLVADGEFELSNRLITRFNEADKSVQEQVLSLLLPEKLGAKKRQRVCLIGLRGAGKSTLGRLLSDSLALPFVELNREIESLCGMSVAELMSLYGQEGYRRLEFQAIEKLVDSEGPLVFAAAGGIVSESDTYQLLLENFYTVWLKAAPEVHMARVIRQGDTRLAAGTNPEAMAQLRSILTSREELYAAADFMIDTTDSSIDEVLQELLLVVRQVQSQSA
jgi:XRE family aerobic/anaerobic benzoate catabolism transcriptional regulator